VIRHTTHHQIARQGEEALGFGERGLAERIGGLTLIAQADVRVADLPERVRGLHQRARALRYAERPRQTFASPHLPRARACVVNNSEPRILVAFQTGPQGVHLPLPTFERHELDMGDMIAVTASGSVHSASWRGTRVALKQMRMVELNRYTTTAPVPTSCPLAAWTLITRLIDACW
jgi:hypothetical protein